VPDTDELLNLQRRLRALELTVAGNLRVIRELLARQPVGSVSSSLIDTIEESIASLEGVVNEATKEYMN